MNENNMPRLIAGMIFSITITLFFGLLCLASSAALDLDSQFLQDKMWSGSDGAYSVDLGNGKAVWLFSDTFIGLISGGKRQHNAMINNSIGIQDLKAGKMSFFWKQSKKAASFFPGGKGYWLWLGDGVLYNNKLYCFAKRISAIPGHEGEPFGFVWKKDELIVVENPKDDPSVWRSRHLLLPFTTNNLHVGTACMLDGQMLYVMGLNEKKKQSLLTRISLKHLEELQVNSFEFLQNDNLKNAHWSKSISACTPLFDQSAAEASICKIGNKYVCIFHSSGAGDRIVARTARNIIGPWSAEKLLYTVPENLCKRGMCYAAKGHPEQPCRDGSMIVTFLINPGKLEAHDKDPYAYFPRAVE
ncbi:MAG: DUF4185 domain-containing protein, partial [Candidatus Obscuribacterales bacterium]|nr:DUF4185 domain-containing protein [Candidatus Obscuribacterales bacterium]